MAAYRDGDSSGMLYVLPVNDPEAGVAGAKPVTISGTATEAGTLSLYIGEELVQVPVAAQDNAAAIATAAAAAVNADTSLPCTAAAAEGVLTLTAKHKSLVGADFAVNVNLLGKTNGQTLPAGVGVSFGEGTSGAGVYDLEPAFKALKDEPYEFIGLFFDDATAWNAAKSAMAARWDYAAQLYGHCYTAKRGTVDALVTAAKAQNDPHLTLFGVSETDPNGVAERLGATIAQVAVSIRADPARPLQTLVLTGIPAPRQSDRFERDEREMLLTGGVATYTDTSSGTQIERAVTTYTKNAQGAADNSYQDSETLHTLGYVLRFLRSRLTSKYGRHKLASDGTSFGEGQAVVTPKIIRSELIAAYSELETAGLVENTALFKKYLVVERDATDPNRINVLFPPDLVNQLRILAVLAQFRLQY